MQVRDRGSQGQAEPEARLAAALVEPDEALQHATAIGFGDAGAMVGDADLDHVVDAPRRHHDGRWRIASAGVMRQYRLNIGTIVELPLIKVRLRRGRVLGEVEEYFIQGLVPGDTFIFAGRLLRFDGVQDLAAVCAEVRDGRDPKVPAYGGGRLPLTTSLAEADRKKAVSDFQARMYDQAISIKCGDVGIVQATRANVENYKPYRIPRMWDCWFA